MDFIRLSELKKLEAKLGYEFQNIETLNTALTHTSYVKGDGMAEEHNERLEFLGDAVLELCVTELLFNDARRMNEGSMTRLRAQTVCEVALSKVADELELGRLLRLGKGEDHSGGRRKPSILGDAVESVIGAIYVDGGMEKARAFILSFAKESLSLAKRDISTRDNKTALQEYVQKHRLGAISYDLISSKGPDHQKTFYMRLVIGGKTYGEGEGRTKQDASQAAAGIAMKKLVKDGGKKQSAASEEDDAKETTEQGRTEI